MLVPSAFPASAHPPVRAAIVIDLIGDVDSFVARSFGEAVDRLAHGAGEPVVLNLQRVSALHASGVTVLASAIAERRRRGIAIDVVADARRVRAALSAARVSTRIGTPLDHSALLRHVMIVHNADPTRDCA